MAGIVCEKHGAGLHVIGQGVVDWSRGEIVNDEVLVAVEGSGVEEDLWMVGVQVFKVAIDEGWGLGAKGDELAGVVVDRVRIGGFLGGVDGGVVGIDGKPGFCGGGSEAGVGAIGPLHWGASVIAAGSAELGEVLISGEGMTGLDLVLTGVFRFDVVVIGDGLERIVGHAELVALEEVRRAFEG